MLAVLHSLGMFIVDLFKPRLPARLRLRGSDRALRVWMTRLWPSLLGAAHVVQPETILRWHRAGFKAFWRWKSRNRQRITGRRIPISHCDNANDE